MLFHKSLMFVFKILLFHQKKASIYTYNLLRYWQKKLDRHTHQQHV